MAEPIDFRSYRKAPPAPPAPAAASLPGEGRLPLQPGTVIPVDRLTPAERAGLEQVGWKPGTGVPTNLADAIARATADHAHELPVRPDTPPLVVTETPIDRLPEERKRQLAAAVQQADLQRKHLERLPRIEQPGFQHGIDAAIAAASAAPPPRGGVAPGEFADRVKGFAGADVTTRQDAARTLGVAPTVLGAAPPQGADVSPPTPWPPVPSQRGNAANETPVTGFAAARSISTGTVHINPHQAAKTTAELAGKDQQIAVLAARVAELEADRPGSGAIATPNCPHCGWDLERPDEVEPTEEDKLGYLAMLLGGTAVPGGSSATASISTTSSTTAWC
jgi:hypothetical protein